MDDQSNEQMEAPVITAIQAIDQYGNVLASAQNPNAFSMKQMKNKQTQMQMA